MQKNKAGPCTLYHILKFTLNELKAWNVRAKTTKVLDENTRVNLHDLGFNNGFLHMTTKAHTIKEKLDSISTKFKLLCLKWYYQEGENASHRMGENICKSYIW